MRIVLDVDGVLANLHTEWLRRYNRDFNDTVTPADITEWEMESFVKMACGDHVYTYLRDEDLYEQVKPIAGAVAGVKALRALSHQIIYASNCVQYGVDQKYTWLVQHGFLSPSRGMEGFISIYDKSLLRCDVLVDDRFETVAQFSSFRYGCGIVFNQPWNRKVDYPAYPGLLRANNWPQVVDLIKEL